MRPVDHVQDYLLHPEVRAMPDHQADCILPLIDQIRTLHLGKDDLLFIRVKEETTAEDMKRISDVFNEAFPHNLVYVLDNRIDLSVVRPDSELAKKLGPYPTAHIDGSGAAENRGSTAP